MYNVYKSYSYTVVLCKQSLIRYTLLATFQSAMYILVKVNMAAPVISITPEKTFIPQYFPPLLDTIAPAIGAPTRPAKDTHA